MSVYTIDTTLRSRGEEHSIYYYPDGYDHYYPGYVTSFAQYKDELRKNLTPYDVKLYIISSSGRSKSIDDERDLRNAVENLPDGGELAVTAIKEGGGCGNGEPTPPGPYCNDVGDVLRRFDVGIAKSCYYGCRIREPRYFWDSSISICCNCYYNMSDKSGWNRSPWSGDVPDAVLRRDPWGSVRDDVTHLQYILTRLGFMRLSDTDGLVGSYRSLTEEAVRRFRRYCSVYGGDLDDYDHDTERELLRQVKEFRRRGARYI